MHGEQRNTTNEEQKKRNNKIEDNAGSIISYRIEPKLCSSNNNYGDTTDQKQRNTTNEE